MRERVGEGGDHVHAQTAMPLADGHVVALHSAARVCEAGWRRDRVCVESVCGAAQGASQQPACRGIWRRRRGGFRHRRGCPRMRRQCARTRYLRSTPRHQVLQHVRPAVCVCDKWRPGATFTLACCASSCAFSYPCAPPTPALASPTFPGSCSLRTPGPMLFRPSFAAPSRSHRASAIMTERRVRYCASPGVSPSARIHPKMRSQSCVSASRIPWAAPYRASASTTSDRNANMSAFAGAVRSCRSTISSASSTSAPPCSAAATHAAGVSNLGARPLRPTKPGIGTPCHRKTTLAR